MTETAFDPESLPFPGYEDLLRVDPQHQRILDFAQGKIQGHSELPIYLRRDSLLYFYWYFMNDIVDRVPRTHNLLNTEAITREMTNRKLLPLNVAVRIFQATRKLRLERQSAPKKVP